MTMDDTRLGHWTAVLGEVRTEAADMSGMVRGERASAVAVLRLTLDSAINQIKALEQL